MILSESFQGKSCTYSIRAESLILYNGFLLFFLSHALHLKGYTSHKIQHSKKYNSPNFSQFPKTIINLKNRLIVISRKIKFPINLKRIIIVRIVVTKGCMFHRVNESKGINQALCFFCCFFLQNDYMMRFVKRDNLYKILKYFDFFV